MSGIGAFEFGRAHAIAAKLNRVSLSKALAEEPLPFAHQRSARTNECPRLGFAEDHRVQWQDEVAGRKANRAGRIGPDGGMIDAIEVDQLGWATGNWIEKEVVAGLLVNAFGLGLEVDRIAQIKRRFGDQVGSVVQSFLRRSHRRGQEPADEWADADPSLDGERGEPGDAILGAEPPRRAAVGNPPRTALAEEEGVSTADAARLERDRAARGAPQGVGPLRIQGDAADDAAVRSCDKKGCHGMPFTKGLRPAGAARIEIPRS